MGYAYTSKVEETKQLKKRREGSTMTNRKEILKGE